MCGNGDGAPGSYAEATAMAAAGLDYLNLAAADGEIPDAALGEVLLGLEAAGARQAAARASVLSRFDAADAHDADAYQNSTSWLRDRAGMTQSAARRQLRQARLLCSRPRLAQAMREGRLSESWAEKIIALTRVLPEDLRDLADQLILQVLDAGCDFDDVAQVIARLLERAPRDPDDDGPGDPGDEDGFGDRSLRLETTLGGAGVLHGNLTPEAAAAVQAVLDSLGKKHGKEDARSKQQRDHDALLDASHRLLGSRLLPDRAGSDTRAEVRISFADLAGLSGADTLTEAWLTGQTAEPGWLTGEDAEAAACDALISPVVTATPDWDVAGEMICLIADALGRHGITGPAGPGGGDSDEDEDRPPLPLPPGAWAALLYEVGRLAVKFVSGPGSVASLLRTGLLREPFTGKSVPLDVGLSSHIPDSIRRAVIARAGGHCEWPGGCDVPAAACDVHHVKHRKDGGLTSVASCILACQFYHDVAIHRWGWRVELQADGSVTATSPDGTQVLRGHPSRGPRPRVTGRPPPVPVA